MTRRLVLAAALVLGLLGTRPAAAQGPSAAAGAADGPPPPGPMASVTRDAQGRATLRAHPLTAPLHIDGKLDEAVYREVASIGNFVQYQPDNGAPATEPTEVWVLFDDHNFYVCGRAYDDHPERWVLNEMQRDIPNVSNNESIGFSIDTFHDRRNGYLFELNAIGGFLDAQITNEGFPPNSNWNTVWESKTGRFPGGWTFEIAVPFRSLRYPPGRNQVWGFDVRRIVRWKNEESNIVRVPASLNGRQGLMQVSLSPRLVGLEVPPGSKNVELRPYGISKMTTDRLATPPVLNNGSADGGLDVKYGVTQNLTADFTVNTDFAQVEVDEQQVNLTRFSLFYPEKRTFFLEGQGIFNFGIGAGPNTNGNDVPTLFFSRQIGLSRGQVVPIQGGGRLTGKVGKYTLGVLDIRTGNEPAAGAIPTNFGVVRLKRDVLRRSAVGLIYTGRSQSFEGPRAAQTYGVDGTFSFFNDLNINTYLARTDTPGLNGDDLSYRGQFNYAGDRYGLVLERLVVDQHFNPEVGFVRRPDARKWTGTLRFSPRPRVVRAVRKYLYQLDGSYIADHAGTVQSRQWGGTFGLDMNNGDTLRVVGTESFEFLPLPFPIDRHATIPAGGYTFGNVAVAYTLGPQRHFAGTVDLERGSFYDGVKTSVSLSGGRLEVTPQIQVQPGVSINRVDLPWGTFTAQQLQTRVVYTLTPRAFVAGLVQFNSGTEAVSTNLRLRWEYRPGSELFVVYTDERNALTQGFPALTNRALVVKIAPLVRF